MAAASVAFYRDQVSGWRAPTHLSGSVEMGLNGDRHNDRSYRSSAVNGVTKDYRGLINESIRVPGGKRGRKGRTRGRLDDPLGVSSLFGFFFV